MEKATKDGPITRDLLVDEDDEKSQFDFIEKFFKAAQTQKLKVYRGGYDVIEYPFLNLSQRSQILTVPEQNILEKPSSIVLSMSGF